MEAVASLLAGLPLQPEESDRGDLMEAKSQIFLKYGLINLIGYINTVLRFKNMRIFLWIQFLCGPLIYAKYRSLLLCEYAFY